MCSIGFDTQDPAVFEDIQNPQSDAEVQDDSRQLGDEQAEWKSLVCGAEVQYDNSQLGDQQAQHKSIVCDAEVQDDDSQPGIQRPQKKSILTSPNIQEEDSQLGTKNRQRKSMVCDGMQSLQESFDGPELQNSPDEGRPESPKANKKRRLCLRRKRPKALGRGVPANYVAETADTVSQEKKINASEKLDLLLKEVTSEREREK